jgi:hypothetical protein
MSSAADVVVTLTRWDCVLCGESHPSDHEGIFCTVCKRMACCSCELRMSEHTCDPRQWPTEHESDCDASTDPAFSCSCPMGNL